LTERVLAEIAFDRRMMDGDRRQIDRERQACIASEFVGAGLGECVDFEGCKERWERERKKQNASHEQSCAYSELLLSLQKMAAISQHLHFDRVED
jgi:hypothetical protein